MGVAGLDKFNGDINGDSNLDMDIEGVEHLLIELEGVVIVATAPPPPPANFVKSGWDTEQKDTLGVALLDGG